MAKSLQCDRNRCTLHVFLGAMVPSPPCTTLDAVEVANAWREFDPESRGELPEHEVVRVLTELGEVLSEQEARAVLQSGDFRGGVAGTIDYVKFSKHMIEKKMTGWTP